MAISANNINLGTIHPNEVHHFILPVFNSGEVDAEFSMGISYLEGQQEHKVLPDWVTFDPQTFTLAPFAKDWKQVAVQIKVKKGKDINNGAYFCFVEACHKGCSAIKLSFSLNKK